MPADPPSSPALRASDADRDRVIELLRTAVADGRLDPVEFDTRLDTALAARTIGRADPAHHRSERSAGQRRRTRAAARRDAARAARRTAHHQGEARLGAP
jgi:Domain of unknown function (DUF1707)